MALSLFLRLTPALYKSFFNFFIDSFLRTVWSRLKGLSIGIGGGYVKYSTLTVASTFFVAFFPHHCLNK